jgi:hypothetical protein
MDKNINDLFRLVQKWKPQEVGIEVTGQQGGFISWIQDQMLNRNVYFTLASDNNGGKPGIKPGTGKLVRFNTMLPTFKLGKMYFPQEMKAHKALAEMLLELSQVTAAGFKSRKDDALDTISQLSNLHPWKPSEETMLKQAGAASNMWDLEEEPVTVPRMNSYIV